MYSYTLYIQFPSSGTHLTMDECRACDRQPFGGMIEQVLPDLIAWHSLDNEENLRAAYEYAKNAGMTDGASEVYCMAGEDGDEHVINPAFMAEAGSAPSADPESTEQAEQATTEQEAANTMTTAEKLMQYFKENEDDFNDSIEELDSYNGYLGDDRYYAMEDLDELYSGCSATELLNRAFFGHDAENWHYDASGNKEYGAFNPNREYFYYNGYGNLVSADYKDYSDRLDSWFIENLIENADNLCLPDGVAEILAEAEDPEND